MDSFELACQIHTLRQQVAEFVIEEALKEEAKQDESGLIDERAALLMDPTSGFPERFEALMTDMIAGRHVSQIEPDHPGLFRAPTDNEELDENPTDEI